MEVKELSEENVKTALDLLKNYGYEITKKYNSYNPKFNGSEFQDYLSKHVEPYVEK